MTLPPALDLVLRPVTTDDLDVIVSTWLHSYIDDVVPKANVSAHKIAMQDYRPYVEARARNAEVVCLRDEPFIVVAWRAWGEGRVLHYLYVKPKFRKDFGVYPWLIQDLKDVVYTHETRRFRRPEGWEYRPLLKWR